MTNTSNFDRKQKQYVIYRIASIILILISLSFIIHRAWFCDDSYITFRTLDNFVNGYHLTWNIYERVQSYTHPLWLFLLIPFYATTHEIFLTVSTISVSLSALALFILYKSTKEKSQLIIPLVGLAFSNAYVNYSTSGLENALLNLLFSLFLFVYTQRQNNKFLVFLICFLSILVALTRLDAFLVVMPSLIFVFFTERTKFSKKLLQLILGFSPLIFWELFSLFYYGFPFPNTYYAKLNAGFPLSDYLIRGWHYFLDTVINDPITALGLVIGCLAFLVVPKKMRLFSLGIFLYFLYLFSIGGDFMSGRMYSSLLFISFALLTQNQFHLNKGLLIVISTILVVVGFLARCPTPYLANATPLDDKISGQITDERRYFMGGTSVFRNHRFNTSIEMDNKIWGFNSYSWIADQRKAGKMYELPVFIETSIGFFGYFGGPELKVIDVVGLTDPLTARLPAIYDPGWRVGHLVRVVPEGYPQSVATPGSQLADSNLNEYNNHLKVITQSNLFSKGRLLEILRFNFGYYDYLIR